VRDDKFHYPKLEDMNEVVQITAFRNVPDANRDGFNLEYTYTVIGDAIKRKAYFAIVEISGSQALTSPQHPDPELVQLMGRFALQSSIEDIRKNLMGIQSKRIVLRNQLPLPAVEELKNYDSVVGFTFPL
jgi:hypothetical protein